MTDATQDQYCERPKRPKETVKERILRQITVHPVTDCWIWTGQMLKVKGGPYGRMWANGRGENAHRAAYMEWVGPIPKGYYVDHLCRKSLCVNPEHLEAVTPGENNRRANGFSGRNWRKTHCPHGHEYTEENTGYIVRPEGRKSWRVCLTCYPKRRKVAA